MQTQLSLLFLSLLFIPVRSRLVTVNITVDDTFGDPTTGLIPQYSAGLPDAVWRAGPPSGNCLVCYVGMDLSQVYRQTWHEITFSSKETPQASGPPVITVQFTGSAVYVFNILLNVSTVSGDKPTAMLFTVDGDHSGVFTGPPNSSSSILYDQLVYSNTGLENGPHTIVMAPSRNDSVILFDYLVYTAEVDETHSTSMQDISHPSSSNQRTSTSLMLVPTGGEPGTSTSHPDAKTSTPPSTGGFSDSTHSSSYTTRVGAVVGAVLAVVILLALAVGAGLFFLRRRRKLRIPTPMQISLAEGPGHEHNSNGEQGGAPMVFQTPTTSLFGGLDGRTRHSPLTLISMSDVQLHGTDSALHTSIRATIISSPSMADSDQSSKHREELTRRLEVLQRTRSVLSLQAPSESRPSHSEVSSESGTEAAMRALEAEIAMLRGVLASMNVRIIDGHVGPVAADSDEPLPPYVE